MVNRVMQAKLNKLRASKRKAYLNKPRSGGVDAGKIAAHDIFQNRSRVNTTSGKNGENLPVLTHTWMQDLPLENKVDELHDKFVVWDPATKTYVRTPRGEALVKLDVIKKEEQYYKDEGSIVLGALRQVWQGRAGQGVKVFNTIVMMEHGDFSIKLHFSGTEFIFIQETAEKRRVSKTYSNHSEAMKAYKTSISWNIVENK